MGGTRVEGEGSGECWREKGESIELWERGEGEKGFEGGLSASGEEMVGEAVGEKVGWGEGEV